MASSKLIFATLASLVIFLSLLHVSTAQQKGGALYPSDPKIVALGKFAVDENNRKTKQGLAFWHVANIDGAGKVDNSKMTYMLNVMVYDNATPTEFYAVVDDYATGAKELVSFSKVKA